MSAVDHHATLLLNRVSSGDVEAGKQLLPLLYDQLKAIAARQFRGQPSDHTLQPTALVHEAFFRLIGKPANEWNDRVHFFAVAATAMRQILVNHARDKAAQKRGGGKRAAVLNEEVVGSAGPDLDILALNEALEQLKQIDERKHRIVELRFFAGLTVEEIAAAMGLSKTTIETEWRACKAWLAVTLADGEK